MRRSSQALLRNISESQEWKLDMLMLLTHLSSREWQIAASGNEQIGAHFLRLRGISLLLAFLVEVSQFWRGGSAAPSHPEKVGLDCKHSVEEAHARSTGSNRRRGPACSNFEANLTVRSRQKSLLYFGAFSFFILHYRSDSKLPLSLFIIYIFA